MRVVFAGSPDISVPSLVRVSSFFEVIAVITNPDKATGRGKKMKCNPVKEKALELGLKIIQAKSLGSEVRNILSDLKPDILVVFAFGKIFGPRFLSVFPMGGINVHPSLLPKYRGSSPILSSILHGDTETGISVQRINLEMDTGAILDQQVITLFGDESTESLSKYVAVQSAELLAEVLRKLESDKIEEKEQSNKNISYCRRIVKEDGKIDWNESAVQIDRKIRAFNPWPGAFTRFKEKGLMIHIGHVYLKENNFSGDTGMVLGFDKSDGILIQTGSGILAVERLQIQSKKSNDWKAFINGTQNFVGSVLGGE
jgi:methionyl-tRNA formyltransferase